MFLARYKGGPGFYSVEGLKSDGENPVLIQSINSTERDIVYKVNTLDRFKVLYRFGEDFGQIIVNGLILLGHSDSPKKGVGVVNRWFADNRVTNTKNPVGIALPGGVGFKAYILSLTFGNVDPEFHIQDFKITGLVAEPSEKG